MNTENSAQMYVVVITSVCSCGVDTHVYSADTLDEAKVILWLGYSASLSEFDEESMMEETDDDSWQLWKRGTHFNEDNMTGKIYVLQGGGAGGGDSWSMGF